MNTEDIFPIIENQDIAKFEQWINEGFNVNQTRQNPPYSTPLQDAIDELDFNSATEMVERLLRASANPNFWDPRSLASPLMMALTQGHNHIAKLLLEYGADPGVRSSGGMSPLIWSVKKDDLEMVNLLVKYGLSDSINNPGGIEGMNALGIAISRLNLAMVKTLIEAGADPLSKDADLRVAKDIIPSDAEPEIQSQLRNILLKK